MTYYISFGLERETWKGYTTVIVWEALSEALVEAKKIRNTWNIGNEDPCIRHMTETVMVKHEKEVDTSMIAKEN